MVCTSGGASFAARNLLMSAQYRREQETDWYGVELSVTLRAAVQFFRADICPNEIDVVP